MSLIDGKVFTGGPALLGARDTGPARLPGLGTVSPTGNGSLDTWLPQAPEVIEVRNGARGNPWERTVTVREFAAMAKEVDAVMPGAKAMTDLLSGKGLNSGEATRMIEAFTKAIKELQVYKDLIKRLDDPSRFDNLPAEIREELLRSIAEEAAKRGAAISRVETVLQDANRSLAYEVKMVTAAVERAQAGIREVQFATAETNFAQAGKITQLEASLGNYYQDGTPGRALLEEQMTATADRLAGLSAQYTLKVQAGKYVAGIGLAATENPDGSGTSALIIAAEKFAIVNPETYTTGLTNTPDPAHIPFGVDANGRQQVLDLRRPVFHSANRPNVETLADDLLDGAPRIQARDRILKDHLQPGAHTAQFFAPQSRQLLTRQSDPAAGRRGHLNDRPARGRLAATRLAHQTQRFAFDDVERDSRHRLHLLALAHRELDHELLDPQQRRVAQVSHPSPGHYAPPFTSLMCRRGASTGEGSTDSPAAAKGKKHAHQ